MYALAVNGSAKKDGNTRFLLEQVAKPLREDEWEVEIYQLGGQAVHGCLGCGKCWQTKDRRCIVKDDCINEILEKMFRADAIIIGSPTYYANVNAEVKALLDRSGFVSRANANLLRGRVGAAIAAARRAGSVDVVQAIMRMYLISGMVIPGSTYWNMGIGLLPGDAAKDDEGCKNMENLGQTIAILGRTLARLRPNWPD